MNDTAPRLRFPNGIDGQRFLHEYWQKKPLIMRQALPETSFPVSADELAGLACEEEIESRIIIEETSNRWQIRHGPFDESDFAGLPDSRWTLLVQDVDKFLPGVARLIESFAFVPTWRIDDIMISFASDQGGVGPHTDAYDVFLMQATGRRRWRLSYRDYAEHELIPNIEQRILSVFDTDEEWLLEPGDILYLPPGIAHWGIAEGDCMTYSLGFRAPSQRDLAADWFQHLIGLAGGQRLHDPDGQSPHSLAELSGDVYDQVRQLLDGLPATGSTEFEHWFGCHITEPKPHFQILPPDRRWSMTDLRSLVVRGDPLLRHPAARMAWSSQGGSGVTLYCQGEFRVLPDSLLAAVKLLAESRRLDTATLNQILDTGPRAGELLLELLDEGILETDGESG